MAEAFVGRERELAELKRAMDDAAAGQGRVVLVTGEPGIGKTRLVRELAGYAESLGALVLWGTRRSGEQAPALWAWDQPVWGCLRNPDPEAVLADVGSEVGDGARLFGELIERCKRLLTRAGSRFFTTVSALLRQAAVPPLLLVLDGLQWADSSSLLLFEVVARDLPGARVLVVGMYRDTEVSPAHGLAETVRRLPAGSLRLALNGLTEPEVGRLLAFMMGATPEPELVAAVSRATAGNPLAIRDIGHLLASRRLAEHGGLNGETLSDRGQQVINGRFGRSARDWGELLAVTAVTGAPFRQGGEPRAQDQLCQTLDAAPPLRTLLLPGRPPVSLERVAHEAVFRKEGEYWTIAYQGPLFRLKHTIGLGYLARLLKEPGREFHAIDLATAASRRAVQCGDAGQVLDSQAKAAYRRRLKDLAEELDEAERWHDPERAARARSELDALAQQLASGVGLGGRDRRAASDAERARSSVSKALKTAVRKIAICDAVLGEHLSRSVKTGTFCGYDPDPAVPISWRL